MVKNNALLVAHYEICSDHHSVAIKNVNDIINILLLIFL